MREKLEDAPWWVWSMLTGVFFGTVMTIFNRWQQSSSWTAALVGGLISGVLFGAVMGPLAVRQRRKVSALVGTMPRRDLRFATRAVTRGPAPLDPNIREAAAQLATLNLRQASRFRWVGLIFFSVLTVLYVLLAFAESPWWWLAAAASGALSTLYVIWPRHLKRRIEILNQES